MARPSFDRIARVVVSTTVASLAAGCGSGVDTEGMETPACADSQPRYAEGLKLARAVDSFDFVQVGFGDSTVIASSGTRCATATDAAACAASVEVALTPAVDEQTSEVTASFRFGQCVDYCPGHIVVITAGDEVSAITDRKAVVALLGAIDTPIEAYWAVGLAGYSAGCDTERYGVRATDGGYEVAATQLTAICDPIETTQYLLSVTSDAAVSVLDTDVIDSESGSCVGRRPEHLRPDAGRGASALGARLATLAQLEAASIPAFSVLARELRENHAPRALRTAARRARADEVRHAQTMRRHAARFGGAPHKPHVPSATPRALVDIAIDNAREGCVREAYGAVVARFQAQRAADPALRRSLATIASDEARHATLAFRVDAWARRRLAPAECARVERARAEAIEELRAQLALDDPGPEVAAALGLPRPAEAQALFTSLERALAAA